MTKFVLLYTGGGMPESKEEQDAVMAAWGAWYTRLGAAVIDPGNPLGPAKSVTGSGVSDKPISTPPITGYTIITADTFDDALAKVGGHPHIQYGGQVSVHETFQM